jgi:hypothetical protein
MRQERAAGKIGADFRERDAAPKYSHGDVWPATRTRAILQQGGTDMLINKIYVDQVALARSFAATFTAQQDVPARLPGRPIRRVPPAGGGRLVRFLRRLRIRSIIDRGNLTIHFKTKYRSRARHLPWHAGRYLDQHGGNATRGAVPKAN